MEWQAPAVVLEARPLGEGGAVVTVLSEAGGRQAGLARGGASRAQASLWQPGNLVEARWVARLEGQLGHLTAELVHPAAALALPDPLALTLLAGSCALAAGALPEREAYPQSFAGLVATIAALRGGAPAAMADAIRWEAGLLAELGYGLALDRCGATGTAEDLVWVSPRTGRAVSAGAGAPWAERLLPLPALLRDAGEAGDPAAWRDGLRLTGHFLARDVFGTQHRPLPGPRLALFDRVAGLAG